MPNFEWNQDKNEKLKIQRGVSFEKIVDSINGTGLLDVISNKTKYPNQKVFVVVMNNYVYLVPFVEDDKKVFLKTIIPNKNATKKYLLKTK